MFLLINDKGSGYPIYLGLCSIVLCVYKLYKVVIVGAFSVE